MNNLPPESPEEPPPLEIIKWAEDQCDNRIAAFLRSSRFNNTKKQPITCALAPRKPEDSGYRFELSPQLGCRIGCNFCACGPFQGDLTTNEIINQMTILEQEASERNIQIREPYKIAFTDGGELLLNPECLNILQATTDYYRPALVKISTVLPDFSKDHISSEKNLNGVINLMKNYAPGITLQVSLYSTNEQIRQENSKKIPLFSFKDLNALGRIWKNNHPDGRRITLSFTLTDNSKVDPEEIANVLSPEFFRIRLHPYKENNIRRKFNTMSKQKYTELYNQFLDSPYYDPNEKNDNIQLEEYDHYEQNMLTTGGTNALREKVKQTKEEIKQTLEDDDE